MFVEFYCFACGTQIHKEYEDSNQEVRCPKCDEPMYPDYDNKEADEHLANSLDKEEKITDENIMKEYIQLFGDTTVWEHIEQQGSIKVRVFYRNLFIVCGGKVPKTELIKINLT